MRNNPTPRRVRSAHESRSATVRAAAAAPSRRQQSRWQREQHQHRVLFIGIIGLLAAIAAVFVGALIFDNVVRANDVVAEIGSETVTTTELLEEIRPQARQIDTRAQQQPSNPNIARAVEQEKRQLPDSVLNDLIDRMLIEQEAQRLGVTTTAGEVDDRVRQQIADFNAVLNPAPTPEPTSTPEGGAATAVPTVASPTAVGTPTPIPTPTPVPTLDSASYPAALQQVLERTSYTEADFRTEIEQALLREKVEKAFGEEQVPVNQEQIHARHILVGTPEQANEIKQQLDGGADFAELARTRTIDSGTMSTDGDLGWFSRGVMDSVFEAAAFALQPGQTSSAVQTTNGFHIIQVLERDPSRPVAEAQLQTLRRKAFSDALDRRRNSDVRLQLSTSERDWVLSRLGVRP